MAEIAIGTATYDDLLAVPPHLVAEILDGHLVTHPRPTMRISSVGSILGAVLTSPFQLNIGGPRGWWIIDEPELHLGHHLTVPDLAAWRHERMPEIPDAPWLDLVPDWACEVLSLSTERYDKGEKREIYAEAGMSNPNFSLSST